METIVRTRLIALISFLIFSLSLSAQGLNGGSIGASSTCALPSVAASTINNLASPSGGAGGYVYQWEAKIPFSSWTNVINVGNGLSLNPGALSYTTTYRRKVTDAAGAIAYSNEFTFVLTSLSAGTIGYVAGFFPPVLINTSVTLLSTAAVGGSGNYSYEWETSSSENGPWTTIAGVTGLSYTTPVFTSATTVYYRKKSTDNTCGLSVYSAPFKVEFVTTLPLSAGALQTPDFCVAQGSLPSFLTPTIPPSGGTAPYSIQWEQKLSGASTWSAIAGATSEGFQPPVLSSSISYRRKVTDAAGAVAYFGPIDIFLMSSNPNPGAIALNTTLIAPNAPYVAAIELQSPSNAYNITYVWQESLNGGSFNDVIGYSYNNYYPAVQPTTPTCYRRAVKEVCKDLTRLTWTNTVCYTPPNPLTSGTISLPNGDSASGCVAVNKSPGVLSGTNATGGASPYSYQWQKNDDGNWLNISGATSQNFTVGKLVKNTIFRRVVTDAANTVLYSNQIVVNLKSNTALKGGIIDGPIVTCPNTAPGIINNILDACGGGGALQYTWEISTNGGAWVAVTNSNAATYNAASINADTKYRRKVGDFCGDAVYSNEVPVYVYPSVEPGTILPVSQTVCNATQTPEVLGLMDNCHYTNGTVTYQWQKSSSPTGTWTDISGANAAFYQPKGVATTTYYRLQVATTVCKSVAYSNVTEIIVSGCITGRNNSGLVTAANPNDLSSMNKGVKVFPNPVTKGQTVIVTTTNDATNAKVALRSIDGRTFNCAIIGSSKNALQIQMPTNTAPGTYLLQINTASQQLIERVVVY